MPSKLLEILKAFVALDVKTIIGCLTWGNLALAVLAYNYYALNRPDYAIKRFGIAKTFQALAWGLLFLRGEINNIEYVGDILLLVSFYLDSEIIVNMNEESKGIWNRLQIIILVSFCLAFVVLGITSSEGHIRVAMVSIGILVLLFIPTLRILLNKHSDRFIKFIGFNYLLFIIMLLLRGIHSFTVEDMDLFTSNVFQTGTYITLILLMFFNGAGFLLLMYGNSYRLLKLSVNLDPLTQIHNRIYFMKKADEYYQRAMSEQKPLSFLFVDIDFFKKVNDRYGHLFGDEVLKALAKVISANIRPTDLCCRFGGEEFLILLHGTNNDQAVQIGNRLLEEVRNMVFNEISGFKCTASIGVYSDVPDSQRNIQHFIDNADKALYKAKESGRDCVMTL